MFVYNVRSEIKFLCKPHHSGKKSQTKFFVLGIIYYYYDCYVKGRGVFSILTNIFGDVIIVVGAICKLLQNYNVQS